MVCTVNGEFTWFRILGENIYGKTCIMDVELTPYDIQELENLGLGLGKSEKKEREVITQWLLASDIYDPQGFWTVDLCSITDFDCQIEINDGSYVTVDWEDNTSYARYNQIMISELLVEWSKEDSEDE